jgi:hypothetical protein
VATQPTNLTEYDGRALGLTRLAIERRSDGHPIRLVNNGRKPRVTGRYYSIKIGDSVPWESGPELRFIKCAEVDTDVVRYLAQPETMHFADASGSSRYTPDRLDILANGRSRYVEVKASPESADGERLARIAALYRERGHIFRIEYENELLAHPSYAAIEQIQRFRRTMVTGRDVFLLQRILKGRGRTVGDLEAQLHPGGLQKLCALMVRRVVRIDISAGFSPANTVELLQPNGGGS